MKLQRLDILDLRSSRSSRLRRRTWDFVLLRVRCWPREQQSSNPRIRIAIRAALCSRFPKARVGHHTLTMTEFFLHCATKQRPLGCRCLIQQASTSQRFATLVIIANEILGAGLVRDISCNMESCCCRGTSSTIATSNARRGGADLFGPSPWS